MRRPLLVLLLCIAGAACSAAPAPESTGSPSPASPVPSPSPEAAAAAGSAETSFPRPRADLPNRAVRYAEQLTWLHRALPDEVRAWRRAGGPWPKTTAADDVPDAAKNLMFGALYQQRMFRDLAARPWFERKVLRRVPRYVAGYTRAHTRTSRRLRSLVTPAEPPYDYNISSPDSPHLLRDLYRSSQRRYGVHWSILASLNFVESKFGRFQGPSSAGAEGPMQFMPATWDAYGNGGNVWSPRDAIPAAARYLVASGYHDSVSRALYAYNHSWDYVHAIKMYASKMRREAKRYPVYYFWQVFVLTRDGYLQLTGPGSRA